MPARNASYGFGELADGTSGDGVRLTLASKMAAERHAKANKRTITDDGIQNAAFMSWHAARAAGHLPQDLTWDKFLAVVIDAGITDEPPADADQEDDDLDPTQTAAPTP